MTGKRQTRFFDIYITKILKNIDTKAEIFKNSREQLNQLLQIIVSKIVDIVYKLMENQSKNTINWKIIENSVNIFLNGELRQNARNIAKNVIENKFNLIIPLHLLEKYLRRTKYKISKKSISYLTAVTEYLLGEILDLAFTYTKHQKRLRITTSDIEKSLREDVEFQPILLRHNIHFTNGCNIPTIINIEHKKSKSIQTIKKLQQEKNQLLLPNSKFRLFVRKMFDQKISDSVFTYLQHYFEQFLDDIFRKSHEIIKYNNRHKVSRQDIELYCLLKNIDYKKPPSTSISITSDISLHFDSNEHRLNNFFPVSESISEEIPEEIPEEMSEEIPEEISDDLSEEISDVEK